jgi:hypothetical protein
MLAIRVPVPFFTLASRSLSEYCLSQPRFE